MLRLEKEVSYIMWNLLIFLGLSVAGTLAGAGMGLVLGSAAQPPSVTTVTFVGVIPGAIIGVLFVATVTLYDVIAHPASYNDSL